MKIPIWSSYTGIKTDFPNKRLYYDSMEANTGIIPKPRNISVFSFLTSKNHLKRTLRFLMDTELRVPWLQVPSRWWPRCRCDFKPAQEKKETSKFQARENYYRKDRNWKQSVISVRGTTPWILAVSVAPHAVDSYYTCCDSTSEVGQDPVTSLPSY